MEKFSLKGAAESEVFLKNSRWCEIVRITPQSLRNSQGDDYAIRKKIIGPVSWFCGIGCEIQARSVHPESLKIKKS